jgi:ketosteroid isomerase-like protein
MSPRQLVEAWVDAFNRADADGLAALYSEQATNHQVAEAPVVGGCFQRGYWDKLSFLRLHGLSIPEVP